MFPDLLPIDTSAGSPPTTPRTTTPALFSPSEHAERRFWEFFTAHVRNRNTRLAYEDTPTDRSGGAHGTEYRETSREESRRGR